MNAMPPKDDSLSRRSFIAWAVKGSLAGSALLGLGILARYISFQSADAPPTRHDLGLASDYPLGSRIVVPSAQAMIIHDEQGYHALSLVCPHLGCEVNVREDGFACPCHGSRFYSDGSLRNGPASRPLNTLRLETTDDGHLVLFTA